MRLKFSLKNREASIEADVEGLVQKGLQHQEEKDPKNTKYQIKQEEKRKNKELKQKHFIQGMFLMVGIILIPLIMCAIGAYFG